MKKIEATKGIICILEWLIVLPFILYQLKHFWEHRFKPIIKKRKPILNIFYISTLLVTSVIIRPILLLISILGYSYDSSIAEYAMAVRIGCLFISVYLFCFRTYRIVYDFNYNLAVFKKRCLAAVLSPDYDYQNWWLSHKQTFGNTKYLLPFVISDLLIIALIVFALFLFNLMWAKIFVFFNFITVILVYLFLSKYIIAHRDQFVVKREIIYTALIWALLILTYFALFYTPNSWLFMHDKIRDLTLYIMETVCITVLMFISTAWVNRKAIANDTITAGEFKHLHNIQLQTTHKKLDLNGTGMDHCLAMDKTLSHFQGYCLFMEYLLSELSVENLLYITEIVHLKHLYFKLLKKRSKVQKRQSKSTNTLQVMGNNSDDESGGNESENEESKVENENSKNEESKRLSYSQSVNMYNHHSSDWKIIKKKYVLNARDEHLPFISKSIYKSSVMKEPNFAKKIAMIFEKYILESAEYEINIKYTQRKELINVYYSKFCTFHSEANSDNNPLHTNSDKLAVASTGTPNSPSLSYVNNGAQPSDFRLASVSETNNSENNGQTVERVQSEIIVGNNSNNSTKKWKLSSEEYVSLNEGISIEDIQIFNKSVLSIMQLLRGSYIEFCKTKEYEAFAQAYKGHMNLDIFTAFKGQSRACCNCL